MTQFCCLSANDVRSSFGDFDTTNFDFHGKKLLTKKTFSYDFNLKVFHTFSRPLVVVSGQKGPSDQSIDGHASVQQTTYSPCLVTYQMLAKTEFKIVTLVNPVHLNLSIHCSFVLANHSAMLSYYSDLIIFLLPNFVT